MFTTTKTGSDPRYVIALTLPMRIGCYPSTYAFATTRQRTPRFWLGKCGMVDDSHSTPVSSRLSEIVQYASNNTTALARDAVAGLVASVVLIANIISFGTLMFPGELGVGVPIAIWSM